MRVLVTRRLTDAAMDAIRARFETDLADSGPLDPAAAARALAEYDAILPTLGDQFSAAAFAGGSPRCKLLANFGVGYNHIDITAARAAGVSVTNTPDAVTEATADIALTLLLMAARRAGEGERLVRAGQWRGWTPTQLLGTHVTGKTVGIIGMGRIGKAIAARCHFGFGMQVLFFNRSQISAPGVPARQVDDLHQMLRTCDFAVLAVPGGAATRHLIGAAELDALGPHGFLINIARGDVVDEAALIAALQSGRIAGAGLDVYEHEPAVPQALTVLDNVTLLPHLGTAAEDVRTAMAMRALDNLTALAQGRPLPDLVN
ncbi:MAG: D-glycerate dehydrogenase [Paracoccus sp. (in: a-proteobacteria)]|uniref:2-hydroxyacid dehydrogenase n=1 Tax=Paracoccus sp. TaxID=267 RepID=UPI0026DFCA94|nr:D-glycerate dehydrogenase [Paracoccus sp. (in: a-proteobacteria)]MDO5613585.1 D-glycerate dehydrogenase [Paracoccus sp. (in: a-proteobacteria)]